MYINFWYPICRSTDLGNEQPVQATLLLSKLVAFRDSTGHAHVLSDTCVHRGGSLSKGKVIGDCIACPYHGWQYNGEGRCTSLPSRQGKNPPARAKVDSYPVEERYGIVFAFLGDLPEKDRPPFSEIVEWGQEGWRASEIEIIELNTFYERSMENGLDPGHNEFVHPLQGSPQFAPENVGHKDMPWGSMTYTVGAARQGTTELQALRPNQDEVRAESWNHGPNALITLIHLSKTTNFVQYFYEAPVDENHTRIFFINMRSALLEPENDAKMRRINMAVAEEDIVILENLYPVRTPDSNNRELLVAGDESVAHFRRWLADWRERGWRIDLHALRKQEGYVAYAIPSPARRESGNWILDTIPLIPAA